MLTLNTSKSRDQLPSRLHAMCRYYYLSVQSRHRVKLQSLRSPGPFHPQPRVPIFLSATAIMAGFLNLLIPEKLVLSAAGATRLEGLFIPHSKLLTPPEFLSPSISTHPALVAICSIRKVAVKSLLATSVALSDFYLLL